MTETKKPSAYQVLKVPSSAPQGVIDASYEQLFREAMERHKNDSQKLELARKVLGWAHYTLSDPQQRKQHDLEQGITQYVVENRPEIFSERDQGALVTENRPKAHVSGFSGAIVKFVLLISLISAGYAFTTEDMFKAYRDQIMLFVEGLVSQKQLDPSAQASPKKDPSQETKKPFQEPVAKPVEAYDTTQCRLRREQLMELQSASQRRITTLDKQINDIERRKFSEITAIMRPHSTNAGTLGELSRARKIVDQRIADLKSERSNEISNSRMKIASFRADYYQCFK